VSNASVEGGANTANCSSNDRKQMGQSRTRPLYIERVGLRPRLRSRASRLAAAGASSLPWGTWLAGVRPCQPCSV
jgi:hypothetical protein